MMHQFAPELNILSSLVTGQKTRYWEWETWPSFSQHINVMSKAIQKYKGKISTPLLRICKEKFNGDLMLTLRDLMAPDKNEFHVAHLNILGNNLPNPDGGSEVWFSGECVAIFYENEFFKAYNKQMKTGG